jgi:stage III sporulation protein AE
MVTLIGGGTLSLTLAVPFATTVTTAFSVLDSLLVFTSAFSGVYCAIVSSSGNLTSGAVYGTITAFADTFFSGLLAKLSQPVVNIMCSLGFLSCFDNFNLSERITDILKKSYVFLLSLAGTVFSGLVTLKGVLSNGVDSLSSRSVRFVIGQSLPVVGGAVSETYSSLIASLGLIKNTVGIFGIMTVVMFVLPVLIDLFLWSLCFEVISLFSQSFATENGLRIVNVFKNVVTLLSATVIILSTIFIVCIGVCIAARTGEV